MTQPRRSDFTFFERMAVRWGDMDAMGHVNNACFFTYDESARLAYFSALMKDDPRFWKDYGLILAHIGCDFLVQLRPPAELEIGFRVSGFGRSSLRTEAAMFLGETQVAVTRAVLVWFDYRAGTPLALPDGVKAAIRALEPVGPEG